MTTLDRMTESRFRPAARVICVDQDGAILLMCWRDPVDGHLVWEPPGGGIDEGETPFEAARRELAEETGFDPDRIRPEYRDVERDVIWKGQRWVGPEQFFLARLDGTAPVPSGDGFMPDETVNFRQYAWLTPDRFGTVDGDLEPPELAAIVADMLAA